MKCDVCGREQSEYSGEHFCWARSGEQEARRECYQRGYARLQAQIAALTKERDTARFLLHEDDVSAFERITKAEERGEVLTEQIAALQAHPCATGASDTAFGHCLHTDGADCACELVAAIAALEKP